MEFLHELAIAAIMKNEGYYLQEWLDFHLLAGVTHFYLYDNGSTDLTREILKPYIERGVVTYAYRPNPCEQNPVYRETIQKYRFVCKYIAFLDLDEFLYAPDGRSLPEVIKDLESHYGDHGGFTANWCCYASSDEKKADYTRGVLDRFVWRTADDFKNNRHVKSIINPRKAGVFYTPHAPIYYMGNYAVDENGDVVPRYFNDRHPIQKLRINHYNMKSHEEWMERRARNRADLGTPAPYDLEKWFTEWDKRDIHDTGILQYREARKNIPQQTDEKEPFILQIAEDVQGYLQGTKNMNLTELLGSIQHVQQILPDYLNAQQIQILAQQLVKKLYSCLVEGNLKADEVELMLDMLPILFPLVPQEERTAWLKLTSDLAGEAASQENTVTHNFPRYFAYDHMAKILNCLTR